MPPRSNGMPLPTARGPSNIHFMTSPRFLALLPLLFCPMMVPAAIINEYMAANGTTIQDEDGEFSDWIELHNPSDFAYDLSGHFLTDNPGNLQRWQFPPVHIPGGGFLIVWASGKDRHDGELHTNFSISSSGEPLLLVAPDGETIIDQVDAVALPRDISRGRLQNGDATLHFFRTPTPGAPNEATGYTDILQAPSYSRTAGFHSEPFLLEIIHPDHTIQIRYSLDGSTPTVDSPEYTGPIEVIDRSPESNAHSMIPTNVTGGTDIFSFRPPVGEVAKATVVRARAFREGSLESSVSTATYLVFPEGAARYPLPVHSFVTDHDNLFSDERGIYVAGDLADPISIWFGNYHQRGEEWERPASLEFFEENGELILSQDIGLRIHGGYSRGMPQKSFRIYARNRYGNSRLDHGFFPNRTDTSYRRLILRNSGNDWTHSHMRDGTVHRVVEHLNFSKLEYRPSVVFVNGEYWGIKNMRERIDRHYLVRRKQVSPDNIDHMTRHRTVKEGDDFHYQGVLDLIGGADLADPENMALLRTMIDVDNYLDYWVAQVYHGNQDWPHNNIDYWRLRVPFDPSQPPGHDGRWRWILYDVDQSYGYIRGHSTNTLSWVLTPSNPINNREWPSRPILAMLRNEDFRHDFINRFADHLNSTFLPLRVVGIINEHADYIAPFIPEHLARWRSHHGMPYWENQINIMRNFANGRPNFLRTHLRNQFSIANNINLTVSIGGDTGNSMVRVNTLLVAPSTIGIAANPYPWTGVYFSDVPVPLLAVPEPGRRFVGWHRGTPESPGELLSTSRQWVLQESDNIDLTALFEPAVTDRLMHYWSFNHADSFLEPDYTTAGASLEFTPGDDNAEVVTSTGQGFTGMNGRFDEPAGPHLRVNHPIGSHLTFRVPTIGFSDISLAYETRRSGQGAGVQRIAISSDGETFVYFAQEPVANDDPRLVHLDFRTIPEADDNPHFAIRIHFDPGDGGEAGNNRIDNVTVSGTLLPGASEPPVPVGVLSDRQLVAGQPAVAIDPSPAFMMGDGFPGSASSSHPSVVEAAIEGAELLLMPHLPGEATITVVASDSNGAMARTRFGVLVYPAAHPIADSPYYFTSWSPSQREMTFPPSMIFLQSGISDPGINALLLRAYQIPEDDYHEDDLGQVGFPYAATRRTRLNALNDAGISFINTGRGRDVGGALVAVDTR